MDSFTKKTIAGVKWSVLGRIGKNVISFIMGVILARLLSPTEFGLIGMITVIIGFANILTELGFGAALVQKKEISGEELSSVFWLNMMGGTLLTLVFILSAPLIASFYNEPILEVLTIFLSFNFFIKSLNIIQNTLLTRTIDFETLSLIEIATGAISGTVAIIMAYMGFGVWSLVALSLVSSIVTAACLWYQSSWRPELIFDTKAIKNLMGFSLNLLGDKSMNYWTRNTDNLLIGKFLGSDSLGAYSKAYSIMLLPLQNVSNVLSRVMFPSLSKIQDDKERVKRIFLKMTRTIALITFPMMTGLFVVVEPFVIVLFGEQWSAMIPILQILCLIGMTQSIGTLVGNLYLSQGRSDLQFKVGIFVKIGVITGIVVGLNWGAVGVAAGYAVATILGSYPSFIFAGKLVDLTFREHFRNLAPTLSISILMGVAVYFTPLVLRAQIDQWLLLLVQVATGIVLYGLCIHLFKIKSYTELKKLLLEQL